MARRPKTNKPRPIDSCPLGQTRGLVNLKQRMAGAADPSLCRRQKTDWGLVEGEVRTS
nr:MAG TPA: hypothetical protein [Bacteriophage sp.]